jgi:hypothetical protein
MPRELQPADSLDQHWEDSTYIYVALLANSLTEKLAADWLALIVEVEDCWKGQRACWREEMAAQARVVIANYLLDNLAEEISADKINDLRKKNKGWKDKAARESAEYKLYLRKLKLFELVKMGLENQLHEMQHWPELLTLEPEEDLKARAEPLRALLVQGRAAVESRRKAQAATALHRVGSINALVKRLNHERGALYAALLTIAQQNGESAGWADTFYRPAPEPSPDRGEARGKAQAIIGVLSSRAISLSDDQQKKLLSTTDASLLTRWISMVATVANAEALFVEA